MSNVKYMGKRRLIHLFIDYANSHPNIKADFIIKLRNKLEGCSRIEFERYVYFYRRCNGDEWLVVQLVEYRLKYYVLNYGDVKQVYLEVDKFNEDKCEYEPFDRTSTFFNSDSLPVLGGEL